MSLEEGAESTVSQTSSIFTSTEDHAAEEIIELIRGQCLVVYTPKGRCREVVCAGKYGQCRLKDHKKLQRDEKHRGKPGWFRGVFNKTGKLLGGWKDSPMTAGDAQLEREAQQAANRKNAAAALSSVKKKGNSGSVKPSPESSGTWDVSEGHAGAPPGGACVTLGKHLIAEGPTAGPKTLVDVTRDMVSQQQQFQRSGKPIKDEWLFQTGDQVLYIRGRSTQEAVVQEVYPDTEGAYYLLMTEDGTEIQAEGRFLLPMDEAKPRGKSHTNLNNLVSQPKTAEPMAAGTETNQMVDLMRSFQDTLLEMQRREDAQRMEMERLQNMVKAIQQPALPIVNTLSTTLPPTHNPPVPILYAVALGHRPESVGVHDFTTAEAEIKGVPEAVWRRVTTVKEGWEFIADHQEKQLLAPPVLPNPVPTGSHNATPTSLQSALQNMSMSKGPPQEPTDGFSEMRGRVSGPDPSQKNKGKLFDIFYTEENPFASGWSPTPKPCHLKLKYI